MNVSMISEVYLTWAPTIDNVEFSKSPLKSFDEGDYLRNVSVMAGTNRDEMAFFMFFDTKMSELMFEAMMLPLLKSPLDLYELKRLYRNESYDYPAELGEYNWWWWATMRAQTDQHFTCPSRRAVRGLAQARRVGVRLSLCSPHQDTNHHPSHRAQGRRCSTRQ
eukprot:Sspe_Gene.46665::Locus_23393_Transcript_1_1_Confidence_1.000_Length_1369::g.46665::m.46665